MKLRKITSFRNTEFSKKLLILITFLFDSFIVIRSTKCVRYLCNELCWSQLAKYCILFKSQHFISVSADLLWRRSPDWKIQRFTCCRFDGRRLWTWFHVWCGNLLHCVLHVLPAGSSRSLLWLRLWTSFWGQKAGSIISNSFGSLCMKKKAACFFIAICNFCTLHLPALLSSPFIFWVKNKIEWKPLGKRQSDERTKKAAAATHALLFNLRLHICHLYILQRNLRWRSTFH